MRILQIAIVFFWFSQYVYVPFQTPYLASLDVSSKFIGVIVGTYGVSQMVLRFPVGILADCGNRHKSLILVGATATSTASIFRILLDNGNGFLIGNLLSGVASAVWISFMVLYMSFFRKEEQQKATARLVMANNIGMLLGFVVSTLLYDRIGMKWLCAMSIAGGAISIVLCLFLPKGGDVKKVRVGPLIQICTQKRLIVFSLLMLVQQGVQMATAMSFTSKIVEDISKDSGMVGVSSIIYMLSAVVFAKLAETDFCGKLGAERWIPLVFALTAVYCGVVPQCTHVAEVFCLQLLPGMSTGILATYLISEAMKEIPAGKKSTAMGFFQAVYAIGMALLPALCGQITQMRTIGTAYCFLGGICLVAGVGSVLFFRKEKEG